jgi:ornithine carbamoyltransferase
MNIISLSTLCAQDIHKIWSLADQPNAQLSANVAWSFEGNGIRTRTTFICAFRELGLQFTELPNLLKTDERVQDIAGYLDSFFDLYVIRESNHERLQAFANASSKPVINAMSSRGHPCEVLTDTFYLDRKYTKLSNAQVCLWGPTTNVFRSWHEIAKVLGIKLIQVCEERFHEHLPFVEFRSTLPLHADVVITDSWPDKIYDSAQSLTNQHLVNMGSPVLIPTPPFRIGNELLFDPVTYQGFVGYHQKKLLLPIQKAILRFAMKG